MRFRVLEFILLHSSFLLKDESEKPNRVAHEKQLIKKPKCDLVEYL